MLKVVRHPSDQGGTKGESAPPLLRGAGGIRSEIYLQFNYNYLLILRCHYYPFCQIFTFLSALPLIKYFSSALIAKDNSLSVG
ncbi:unknown protein [Microcystis aeruginosa NIES-843]|uniref:Uncharacterized protein n=1 Tax=Microcystis aeruginosa (strain NIES-843 / IAM M-2473) TaxID=449447 RepID=B0JI52_MICAN|nr:unknown protein [Microcystis aeruginosa NIES-843]